MLIRRALSAFVLAGTLLAALSGCRHDTQRAVSSEPTDVLSLARKSPKPADLSAPFNMLVWSQTGASRSPLAVASQLAASAGGDWLAILPKAADDLKWQPQFQARYPAMMINGSPASDSEKKDSSVAGCLAAIQKTDKRIAWENRDGRVLVYFGSDEDLGHARAHPPDTVTGVYLRAHNCAGMLAAVADFWKIKIDGDPALFARRDALLGARKDLEDQDEPRGTMGAISRMYRVGMMGGRMSKAPSDALTLMVQEKATVESVLRKVADVMGGECTGSGPRWKIASISNRDHIAAEIARLKQIVAEKAGTEFVHSSPSPLNGEPVVVIGSLGEEAEQAIESLAAMGTAALPALREYLTPEKASLAQSALRNLLALSDPEAHRSVLEFGWRLLEDSSKPGKGQAARPLLLADIVRALASKADDDGAAWLAKATRDGRVPSELRLKARTALASTGRLALLQLRDGPPPRLRLADFALSITPDGRPSAPSATGAIVPLAKCKAGDGSTWAVFLSGRCGESMGFWLANGKGSKWTEFLYTGQAFPRDNMQSIPWGGRPPGPGALSIKADEKTITLGPPTGQSEDPLLVSLINQLSNRKLSAKKRNAINRQMAMRQQMQWQRRVSLLQETLTVDLAAIRLDTDHDGLTDIVEKRLGTNPTRADTDGDGTPDGVDANPLVPHVTNFSDRQRLVQAVFTTLFGGDPNTDPIIVVLDRRDWLEFTGANAPVFCLTREEYAKRLGTIGSFRVLQFGGLGPSGSTILNVDGPVAYNDSRTRAELHFWQWTSHSTAMNPWMALYGAQLGSNSSPVDYVALFQRRGDAWRLESMRPWQAETADSAMGDLLRKQIEGGLMQ